MKLKNFAAGLIAGILFTISIVIVINIFTKTPSVVNEIISYKTDGYESYEAKTEDVLEELEKYYLEDIDQKNLYEEGIKGLVEGVGDPYTTYYTKEEYNGFSQEMEGSYEGIGVVISYGETKDEILVVAPFKDSPGDIAGILPKDRILKVDDINIVGMDLEEIVTHIKGPKGSEVVLGIRRDVDGVIQNLDIPITRDVVEVITAKEELLEDSIGYIMITGFQKNTDEQFEEALGNLEEQNINSLIIDLRGNPGGYLDTVYNICDRLIEKDQLIVYTENKYGYREQLITKRDSKFDKPIVLLVNGSSASASEILSGAIKDLNKGKLVGTTTFGKGLVQEPIQLKDGSVVKMTVAKYYTPNGNYIHKKGIEPDIVVEFNKDAEADNQLETAINTIKEMLNK